jgi:RNA polymerase sigma factor (sigma-70 family)
VAKLRTVGSDEIVAALADPDNRDLIQAETLKYRGQLDEDQRESAGMAGLWRALEYHDYDHPSRQKFTTSLWKFVHFECRRELKKERRRRGVGHLTRHDGDVTELPESLVPPDCDRHDPDARETRARVEGVLETAERFLPAPVTRAVRRHFFENRTVDEIGELEGCSKEGARARLELGLRRLREMCGADDE